MACSKHVEDLFVSNLKLSKLSVRTCVRLPFYNIGLHKILSYGRFNIIAQECTW